MIKSNTRFHKIWENMKARCNNPNATDYYRYGGRGIKICNKWQKFKGFFEDMYSFYKDELTLDRIDNNKGYSKDNCRWTTFKQQANNRSNNRLITYKDRTKTLQQWADELAIKQSTLGMRFYVYRWDIERCLNYA